MFSFFRKKNIVRDLTWLSVDMHSHLLPSIDDGAKNLEQSLSFIKSLYDLGLAKFYCTPHIFKEIYPNTKASIYAALDLAKKGIYEAGYDIEIMAAAEYMIDSDFRVTDQLVSFPGKYLLIEMSYLNETPNIEQIIFELQLKGYKIILAHPERYNFYHKNQYRYQRLKDMGCLFQLNLLSIIGYYGKEVKTASEHLLKYKLYELAGTDLHHNNHLEALTRSVKSGQMFDLIGNYDFQNKTIFN